MPQEEGAMATSAQDEREANFESLKRYGTRWAVLTALAVDLKKHGVGYPSEVHEELKLARMKIMSACFSPCEVGCALGKVEGQLVSAGASLGGEYLRPWFDLLADSMSGRLEPGHIAEIPSLQPVASDCTFLPCRCG